MRVKVGNTWYEAEPDQPIMVQLSEKDKSNIANMPAEATMYALFDDSCEWTNDSKLAWMEHQ